MSVQRVVVVRTGGFAGVRREAEIDDPDRAAAFADALPRARHGENRIRRDGFEYAVTVYSTSGTRTHEVDEAAIGGALRQMLAGLF